MPEVNEFLAQLLGALARAQNAVTIAVLAAFAALGVRALVRLARSPERGFWTLAGRGLNATLFLGVGLVYAMFTLPVLAWDGPALALALALIALVALPSLARARSTPPRSLLPRPTAALGHAALLLALMLLAALTLMRAGFLSLTTDRPVLLLDVTGETAVERVRWAPAGEDLRTEDLTTHRVVLRTPEGQPVADLWLYGDQIAVKGRVLRLSPLLNAAGLPNLFELQFAHNGWLTPERHNAYPHVARALRPLGPLVVHPWWRGLQRDLLARFERAAETSPWAVRALTTESTYFALCAADGRPVRRTYRLVLTPGGLTAG